MAFEMAGDAAVGSGSNLRIHKVINDTIGFLMTKTITLRAHG